MDDNVRQRTRKKLLRVTFPNGRWLCYKSTTMTLAEALQMIDVNRLQEIKLEKSATDELTPEALEAFLAVGFTNHSETSINRWG